MHLCQDDVVDAAARVIGNVAYNNEANKVTCVADSMRVDMKCVLLCVRACVHACVSAWELNVRVCVPDP